MDEYNTLSKARNPAFEFCEAEYWLAYRDGKPAGRIAALINHRYIEKWGNKYGRFGWVDFIEDFDVARALFATAEGWLRDKGMAGVNGPMGFTDLDKEGLLIEGFDQLGTMPMIYNHLYCPEFLERLGYRKDVDWLEYEVLVPKEIPDKVLRVQNLIPQRTGMHVYDWKTPAELERKFAKPIFALLDEAYAKLYGTTPLSDKQVQTYVDQYLGFADPRFIKIVGPGRQAGFLRLAFPSLFESPPEIRRARSSFGWVHLLGALRHPVGIDLLLIAVNPKHKGAGAVAFLDDVAYRELPQGRRRQRRDRGRAGDQLRSAEPLEKLRAQAAQEAARLHQDALTASPGCRGTGPARPGVVAPTATAGVSCPGGGSQCSSTSLPKIQTRG
ncbi:MAG: N-acetyltransferase [Desulfobacterales bacterium]|nr:N-acetyltransferase [Desulfobacterales bacterium]